jgi:hypothetical protein
VKVQLDSFITLVLDGSEGSALRKELTVPSDSLLDPRSGLDVVEEKSVSYFCRESKAESSAIQPVARRYV